MNHTPELAHVVRMSDTAVLGITRYGAVYQLCTVVDGGTVVRAHWVPVPEPTPVYDVEHDVEHDVDVRPYHSDTATVVPRMAGR